MGEVTSATGLVCCKRAPVVWAPVEREMRRQSDAAIMKRMTVKLAKAILRQLSEAPRVTGRTVAALIREGIEGLPDVGSPSVYEISADLAGSMARDRQSVTNKRRRFAARSRLT